LCKTLHNRVCKMTGLDFVVYSLRHIFATRAYRVRPDALGLMRVLGHSSIKMVARYVNDAEQHARDFMTEFEKRTPATGRGVLQ
jgi:integrase